ncbi:uroporphyrinogen decarboxylase family protein [Raineyella sp. LH-20]|uniref:uroporphyrinogen decarboxylase family protein n=1 Tax=Raineyella sp. LH-20 TaxID=3081204 RepID=UPI0029552914|nr:uroporphyrinogen decarboxylase family protein [Raineyella sp. LH-20]WOP19700.1 uroporphyrinogen decarboxylase family protein [Raineyella sp. LH-20]
MAVQTTAAPGTPARPGQPPADRRSAFTALLRGDSAPQHGDEALHDDPPRRFLTSAWQHFVGEEYDPVRFATATVEFNRTWDWDWVKINPRAVYYAEAWGAIYDPAHYVGVIPRLVAPAITGVADLATIRPLDPTTNPVLAEHLTSATLIREQLPDRALLQTVFSPLSVLLQLAGLPLYPGDVVPGATVEFSADELLTSDPAATHQALAAIAQTLSDYARHLTSPITAGGSGLDGIFYAVTGTANNGLIEERAFEEFSRPYDQQVLDAVGDSLVVLHTCGPDSHPERFTDLRIDALHWDQFQPGNPPLDTPVGVTVVGGANKDLFGVDADPTAVAAQLGATLAAAPDRPFLLAPSCTVPTPAAADALKRLREVV